MTPIFSSADHAQNAVCGYMTARFAHRLMACVFVVRFQRLRGDSAAKSRTELKFGALPYREGEIMESAADIGALERLGWRPAFTLEQGLAHAIEAETIK